MGIQNGTATWEESLAVSFKTKHTLTMGSNNHFLVLPKLLKTYIHVKPTPTICLLNCQNLKLVGKWINQHVQTMEYYLALRRNELASQENV